MFYSYITAPCPVTVSNILKPNLLSKGYSFQSLIRFYYYLVFRTSFVIMDYSSKLWTKGTSIMSVSRATVRFQERFQDTCYASYPSSPTDEALVYCEVVNKAVALFPDPLDAPSRISYVIEWYDKFAVEYPDYNFIIACEDDARNIHIGGSDHLKAEAFDKMKQLFQEYPRMYGGHKWLKVAPKDPFEPPFFNLAHCPIRKTDVSGHKRSEDVDTRKVLSNSVYRKCCISIHVLEPCSMISDLIPEIKST